MYSCLSTEANTTTRILQAEQLVITPPCIHIFVLSTTNPTSYKSNVFVDGNMYVCRRGDINVNVALIKIESYLRDID